MSKIIKENIDKRKQNLKEMQDFLLARKIKSEIVLGFVCFDYNKRNHRVSEMLRLKQALNIPL